MWCRDIRTVYQHSSPDVQDCSAQTDWDVFKLQPLWRTLLSAYRTMLSGSINTCVDNIVPTIQVKKSPNQKLWINSRTRSTKLQSLDWKKPSQRPKGRTERSWTGSVPLLSPGCGLQYITDYRTSTSTISSTDSLPDHLSTFYTSL